ncbi:hypothetical protein NL676_021475, partial [Syzygium grande]
MLQQREKDDRGRSWRWASESKRKIRRGGGGGGDGSKRSWTPATPESTKSKSREDGILELSSPLVRKESLCIFT